MRETSSGELGQWGRWPALSEGPLPARANTGVFQLELRHTEEKQGFQKERTSQTR